MNFLINPWLVLSFLILAFWSVVYYTQPPVRKKMRVVSCITAPLGLTEFIFVPDYWSPPSLFNLTARYGFDIESVIFAFAIGGIAAVAYEVVFQRKLAKITQKRTLLWWGVVFLPLSFLPLLLFFRSITAILLALVISAAAVMVYRRDLIHKMLWGGVLMFIFYFVFFYGATLVYPGLVSAYWNLQNLWGVFISGLPLEELLYGFLLGVLWSGYYEFFFGYGIK